MCGIMGFVVSGRHRKADSVLLESIIAANVARGTRGYGAWVWDPSGSFLVKEMAEISPDIAIQCTRLGTVCAIHTRAPTGGQDSYKELERVHPFSIGHFLFAHNGLLLNWRNNQTMEWLHDASNGKLSRIDVDSVAIAAGIQRHYEMGLSVHASICYTMEAVEGQAGCWLWDDQVKALYLWRVMSTVYIRLIDGVYYFSSAMVDGVFTENDLLTEGTVIRLLAAPFGDRAPPSKVWTNVGTGIEVLSNFNFKTPY